VNGIIYVQNKRSGDLVLDLLWGGAAWLLARVFVAWFDPVPISKWGGIDVLSLTAGVAMVFVVASSRRRKSALVEAVLCSLLFALLVVTVVEPAVVGCSLALLAR